ncbi:hypothetical protein PITC_021520 [Penicillium italicum]|uniref:Uncharacterized protein n=1 Tax=Penicillium italicum TaxID=40296 RepID=A0A0A2KWS1_PENIT|nr:hypothetical protein PITC_021520 [Penicillium italicum]
MTASSGQAGSCRNAKCNHWNDAHNRYTCKEAGCRKQWKICQTGDHGISGKWAICSKCEAHPAGGPDGFEEWIDLTI